MSLQVQIIFISHFFRRMAFYLKCAHQFEIFFICMQNFTFQHIGTGLWLFKHKQYLKKEKKQKLPSNRAQQLYCSDPLIKGYENKAGSKYRNLWYAAASQYNIYLSKSETNTI